MHLETLAGEVMANFMNGSRLKKYNEPLTENMLCQMHEACTRKEAQALLQQQAREEAKARAAKAKARRHTNVFCVHMMHDEDYVDPFYIVLHFHLQEASHEVATLIDSGADCNILSYDMWVAITKPYLQNIPIDLRSFLGEDHGIEGKCHITLSIQGH